MSNTFNPMTDKEGEYQTQYEHLAIDHESLWEALFEYVHPDIIEPLIQLYEDKVQARLEEMELSE